MLKGGKRREFTALDDGCTTSQTPALSSRNRHSMLPPACNHPIEPRGGYSYSTDRRGPGCDLLG